MTGSIRSGGRALGVFLAFASALPSVAQEYTYQVLHRFAGAPSDGAGFAGTLIRDSQGNFYGTSGGGEWGLGSVFKMTPEGTVTLLHSFAGNADGGNPVGPLARDSDGNLYGAAIVGGQPPCDEVFPPVYCGVVFKLATSGEYTVLYAFTGGADGGDPFSGPVRAPDGSLYGTTYFGGGGSGVIYEVDPAGNETVLHTFTGGDDGGYPQCPLIGDAAGNLYGTTVGGGQYGYGVVFKVDPAGDETVLYSFTGGTDGAQPYAGLSMDAAGNLYGTTYDGGGTGNGQGYGVVYELDQGGIETVLYTFTGLKDGGNPYSGVVLDPEGNVYGATYSGGDVGFNSSGGGVVYRVDTAGNETVLHAFTGGSGGALVEGGLFRTANGDLYGGTLKGGDGGDGVMFRLSP